MYTKILFKKLYFSEKLCSHEEMYWLDKKGIHKNNILIPMFFIAVKTVFTVLINSSSAFLS